MMNLLHASTHAATNMTGSDSISQRLQIRRQRLKDMSGCFCKKVDGLIAK
jgi:hypothetical protein